VNVAAPLGGTAGFSGATVHAASPAHSASADAAEAAMEWIVLEALVALAAGLAIVWWTMSPARRRDREDECREAGKACSDEDDKRGGDA
jgi:hypothetical protein